MTFRSRDLAVTMLACGDSTKTPPPEPCPLGTRPPCPQGTKAPVPCTDSTKNPGGGKRLQESETVAGLDLLRSQLRQTLEQAGL